MNMLPVKLYLFGPPRLEHDGRETRLSHRKDLAVLIYLAVTRHAHHREALAAMFWPEGDPRESRANLRRTLHRLRKNLGEAFFDLAGDSVQLSPAVNLWLDTQAFREAIVTAQPQDGPDRALSTPVEARLAGAADLYTGDFLAGFTLPDSPGFDEWQFFESESLRQDLAEVLLRLAQAHQGRGEYAAAIPYARRWLALDTLHEPAQRLLMELYARSGQVSAALRQYEACVQMLREQLGVDPEPETAALYEKIRKGRMEARPPDPAAGASPRPAGLPTYLTPFVGREAELEEIQQLLADPDCRLLTLIGPGGIGKTRLAVQAAGQGVEMHRAVFPDGVAFISLIPLHRAEELVQAAARALNFSFLDRGDPPQKQLLDYLRSWRALLVLDNAEHLLGQGQPGPPEAENESLPWVLQVLAAAPGIKFLVTSRSRLNVQGEQLFPVGGLATPDSDRPAEMADPEALAGRYSAMGLFRESAGRVRPGFRLTSENLADVARICWLVQGMPLAVELAAAWVELLSPAEIAAEIERSLDFLEGTWRDLPERQRSLRAVFEASWRALSAGEREIFLRLTVFRGGFTRQAGQQVAGASLKMLMALTNKSWLQREASGRYGIHELLRQYASEAFQQNPTAWEAAKARHRAWYAGFLKKQGEAMKGPGQQQAFAAVAADFQNIRAAWLSLVEAQAFGDLQEMLFGLVNFCRTGVAVDELDLLLKAALKEVLGAIPEKDRSRPALLAASILTIQVWLSYFHFPMSDWLKLEIQKAWDLAGDQLGSADHLGFWSILLAQEYARHIDLPAGIGMLRRFLDDFRRQGDSWSLAFTFASLGVLLQASDKNEARQCLSQALDLYRRLGDDIQLAYTLRLLGSLAKEQQSYREATHFLEEALEAAERAGDLRGKALTLWDLGGLYLHCGEFQMAFRTYDEQQQVALKAGWRAVEIFALSSYSFEAVRYGDLEEAKEKRRQSMALSQQLLDQSIAWEYWELGEIYRVEGDFENARRQYDKSLELFYEYQVTTGISFYQRGLGDIALSQGAYDEAQTRFEESLRVAREKRHNWCATYALSGLGRAAVGLGELDLARQHLREALVLARDQGNPGLMMVALAGLASLYVAAGDAVQAMELGAFIRGHFASWRETKRQAEAILETAAARLPGAVAAAARAAGGCLELADVVAQQAGPD